MRFRRFRIELLRPRKQNLTARGDWVVWKSGDHVLPGTLGEQGTITKLTVPMRHWDKGTKCPETNMERPSKEIQRTTEPNAIKVFQELRSLIPVRLQNRKWTNSRKLLSALRWRWVWILPKTLSRS